jgi:hypothetical protein
MIVAFFSFYMLAATFIYETWLGLQSCVLARASRGVADEI